MLIIAGHIEVDPQHRDHYVEAHGDLVCRARGASGCLDLAISADPLEAGRVNVFELWESDEHLAAWRAVADAPSQVAEFVGGDVQLHRISTSGSPFP